MTGQMVIIRLKSGSVHGGIFDYQKDRGYFFENDEIGQFDLAEVTHFAIPDPIEVNNE